MVTPAPHHPLGLEGVGESATVGSPAAVVNSVMDALTPYGVRHADMPLTPSDVWTVRAKSLAVLATREPLLLRITPTAHEQPAHADHQRNVP